MCKLTNSPERRTGITSMQPSHVQTEGSQNLIKKRLAKQGSDTMLGNQSSQKLMILKTVPTIYTKLETKARTYE